MYRSSVNEYQEYAAPILGNGSICLQIDYENCMKQERRSEKISANPNIKIWRAGRRRIDNTLLPFGYFYQDIGKNTKLKEYKQELDVKSAVSKTECVYDNGCEIKSQVLVHHDFPLIMIRRKIRCKKAFDYIFEYQLDNREDDFISYNDNIKCGIDIQYKTLDKKKGIICLFSDMKTTAKINGNLYSMTYNLPAGETDICFYILINDSIDNENFTKQSNELKEYILEKGFEQLFKQHLNKWSEYYNEGYVTTDDSSINMVYNTAQYHLKCYTTQWSIPVGLCDEIWQGKYFAFDEFNMFIALLSSNHIKAAYKTPHFRAMGLDKAIKRASSSNGVQQARYPWETLENGDESSPSGFWHDHVFHMACIAMTEYYYYIYTQDKQFLQKEGYPVIQACAMFYINHMIYESADNKLKVAKCTDMERLGASVSNGYMTMCAIIKTIKIFCETADILGLNDAHKYTELPQRLIESLPNDGKEYIPYDGCLETSVGLMGGTYPFDVIDKENELQRNGINSYFSREEKTGNMYAVGTGVCPWYKAWKAIVLGRLGKMEEAYQAIKSTVNNTGNFGEMYEINDRITGTILRPWFATASGVFIQAVNEMFVKYKNGLIYIGATLPKEINDCSFRLACGYGITAEVTIQSGSIVKLRLTSLLHTKDVDVAVLSRLSPEKLQGVNIKERIGEFQIIQCKVMEE